MDDITSGILPDDERRTGNRDRRSGIDRRGGSRGGPDRRRGDRRAAAASVALGVALSGLCVTPVSADIFTRRNDRGVLEATDRPADGTGFTLAYKSKGIVTHSAAFRPSSANAARFEPFVLEAAAREGVDAGLVRAVIRTESAYDHLAVSSAGARGLMQLMPEAAARFGVTNAFDPRENIGGGVRYLRVLLKMFQGDVSRTVAAYNAGEGAVMRHGGVPPYRETREYVRKILGLLALGPALPAVTMASVAAPAAAPARPAEPRILYKWRDAGGIHHIAQAPPAGVEYVTLRLTD
jgi:transglycosylase-like protein with SLT domain